jgi:hypothetical protein
MQSASKFWIPLEILLLCVSFCLFLKYEHDYETKPHWVKFMNGDKVIRSYTTTNPEQVIYYGTNLFSPDGTFHTVIRSRTNLLWTSWHIFR